MSGGGTAYALSDVCVDPPSCEKGGEESMIGDVVEYVDPHGQSHKALITASWDEGPTGARNLVYVDADESKHDSYGRQIARDTSVPHETKQDAPGRFWR